MSLGTAKAGDFVFHHAGNVSADNNSNPLGQALSLGITETMPSLGVFGGLSLNHRYPVTCHVYPGADWCHSML
jgi:hypothetical protein